MSLSPPSSRLAQRAGWILAGLAVLHILLAAWGMRHTGVTNDETAHLTAGYSYWKFNDYRLQPENGNLPQRWAGLAMMAAQPVLDPASAPRLWQNSEVWLIGNQFFFGSGNAIDSLLFLARSFMLVWPLALGGLVYFWSRQLWGVQGALLSAALFAVSPTVLANGWLVTSDTTAAFCLLAAVHAWWRTLQRPGWRDATISVLAAGLAFVAKFSCVLLVPMFGLLALVHLWLHRHDVLRIAKLTAAHGVGIWIIIWIAFGLRYSAASPGLPELDKFFLPWDTLLADSGPFTHLIAFARHWQLLPEAYIEGFAHVRYQGSARDAFLFGEYRSTGWWWFFPACFLLKSSSAELIATIGVIGVCGRHMVRRITWSNPRLRAGWPLLVFVAVYGIFSLLSTLNIGHRHILPLYPVLFIAAGALTRSSPSRIRSWLIALPALSLAGTLGIAPHYLAFFNFPSGGPDRAWTKLVDSSLDWGQELPALARWAAENRPTHEPVYVAYFGSDDVRFRMPEAIPLAPFYDHYRSREWAPLEPGLYCVSASMLQDVYSPYRGPWTSQKESLYRQQRATLLPLMESGDLSPAIVDFGYAGTEPVWLLERLRFNRLTAYLKMKRPLHVVGHAIFVHRLTAAELKTIETGSTDELADLMEAAQDR